ncbi:hypothetical protein [Mitsuaria sp. TWR114]|uniref:hypothetical protein n=1 Tax=Mitsuaria sp. TWR114 TaxID=2601731 RepID=UPI0021048C3D|nr:hypothetical protein [Mitsuaria sp. TWR114]
MQRRQLIARAALTACALLATAGAVHAQAPDWKKIRIGVEGATPRSPKSAPTASSRASRSTWPTRCAPR